MYTYDEPIQAQKLNAFKSARGLTPFERRNDVRRLPKTIHWLSFQALENHVLQLCRDLRR